MHRGARVWPRDPNNMPQWDVHINDGCFDGGKKGGEREKEGEKRKERNKVAIEWLNRAD